MSLPNSLHAYASELDAFERAKTSTKGIRIMFDTHQQARYYSNRLHYARKLDRQENTRALDPAHPLYGKSDHDCFVVSIKEDTEGKWWVYINKNEIIPGAVEEL